MIYTDCTNCGAGIVEFDPNCCMICGQPLCEDCYDESSYCRACGHADEQPTIANICTSAGDEAIDEWLAAQSQSDEGMTEQEKARAMNQLKQAKE
jgi:hypothetical protein